MPDSTYRGIFARLLMLVPLIMLLFNAGSVVQSQEDVSTDPATLATIERLYNTPLLYNFNMDRLREIYQHGQELGRLPNVLAKIGDSNTSNYVFLRLISDHPENCALGPFIDLQATIDYFTQYHFDTGEDSFTRRSLAAYKGFGSASALDPFWSEAAYCESDETPLACEYRSTNASVAVIMLGVMDVRFGGVATYHDNMKLLIEYTLDQGIIPVLTTIMVLPGQEASIMSYDSSMVINQAMLDLSDEYQIPLINLWRAVEPLPRHGIGGDNLHLKFRTLLPCNFEETGLMVGGTMRNLLTLQALDILRRNVLTGS